MTLAVRTRFMALYTSLNDLHKLNA